MENVPITVLMSVYNEKIEILEQSIQSIVNQTFENFIFLIVLDNPNNTEIKKYLQEWMDKDKRIQLIVNEKNLGLPMSLNRGIERINTTYIARMDADDIALEDRLEKQFIHMSQNPQIDLLGTNVIYMDSNGKTLRKRGNIPCEVKVIKQVMKYANVFNHPTFIGKTEVFKKLKYRNLKYSQDYDFTCRLLELGYIAENLNTPYLYYRVNEGVKIEKVLLQKIIKNYIQKMYRRKCLNRDLDEARILAIRNNVNIKNFENDYKAWKIFLGLERNIGTKLIKAAIKVLLSPFYREELFNLISFYVMKRKYKF